MKIPTSAFYIVLVIAASIATSAGAEQSPAEILMKATTLACTFTSEQQTRWTSSGPVKEEGTSQDKVRFLSINHKAGEARILGGTRFDDEEFIPVRIRAFTHSITFFELTKAGALNPVITTVLDDYYPGTTKFIAVRSAHVTSAFNRALATQFTGTCVPD
jgi:hypothetical protein